MVWKFQLLQKVRVRLRAKDGGVGRRLQEEVRPPVP